MESYNIPVKMVAEYFLDKLDEETEDCISNLKLQKLVYYAQGFVMAFTKKKLFNENIEAWTHGPVIPDLYHEYKNNGNACILKPLNAHYDLIEDDDELMDILDSVYQSYGQYSAWVLRDLSHQETPWMNTKKHCTITDKLMYDYFKTRIED